MHAVHTAGNKLRTWIATLGYDERPKYVYSKEKLLELQERLNVVITSTLPGQNTNSQVEEEKTGQNTSSQVEEEKTDQNTSSQE